ncbi:MAG: Flp pilus assembly complex ATPase component TadA, partial [Bdellovibrionales bacterium]|nr:Flp pilus assembly complex ATPase component TadA [Bdellovibrionales bacterium]
MIKLQHLLKAVVDQRATDLHVVAGAPPALRVNGRIARVKHATLTKDDTKNLIYEILNDVQKARLEEQKEIDISFEIKKVSRFRANIFKQQDCISGAFRRIPHEIPNHTSLGLPAIVGDFTKKSFGMVLVTGPTGSGKTTTLASLIDKVNQESYGHIVT